MTVTYLSLFCCSNHGGNSTSAEPKPTLWTVFKRRGIRYFFLSVVDVEANYLIHRAFHYTTLTSVQVSGFKLGNYINDTTQWARKLKKIKAKKNLVKSNKSISRKKMKFFHGIYSILNFSPVQKLIFGHL